MLGESSIKLLSTVKTLLYDSKFEVEKYDKPKNFDMR